MVSLTPGSMPGVFSFGWLLASFGYSLLAFRKIGMSKQLNAVENTKKIALGVEYSGQDFSGWQRQKHSKSIQEALEKALSIVASEPISTVCAGRTDKGVHGKGQVVHFETNAVRPDKAWVLGGDSHLPDSISISWAKQVVDDFHARFSARSRSYRYIIHNKKSRSALLANRVTRHSYPIEVEPMKLACPYFLGEQDFTSVRAANCQSKSCWRNISSLEVNRYGDFVVVDITANAFLYHMVRNIVGILLAIGEGHYQPHWVEYLLAKKDRTSAPATAPATGLYLMSVKYPEIYQIPELSDNPWFW